MIRHLFKLVWNRKRTNLLIVAEILLSFVVVFALVASGLFLLGRYRAPLGFDYRDVWKIGVARNTGHDWSPWSADDASTFARLLQTLESMDEVVAAAGADTAPYTDSVHINGWDWDNREHRSELTTATPGLLEVLDLELVDGRWLREEDAALDWTPIVVDEDLARDLTGDESPLGKRVTEDEEDGDMRVVGIVREYRRGGEFYEDGAYLFQPADLESDGGMPLSSMIVRLEPGTRADFEEPMVKALQAVAKGWSFTVTQVEAARESYLKEKLLPLAAIGLIAGFLLLMVVLGLTGVMWQNVTRRTREIGLRRAIGAQRAHIHRQVVGEVAVTASIAVILGTLLVVQVPLLGPFTFVGYGVVVPAILASAALVLTLAALCGLYPGWSAARIRPAEALHYE